MIGRHFQSRAATALLSACFLLLLCTACGSSTPPISKNEAAKTPRTQSTSVALQPVTFQQLQAGPVIYVALGASDAVGVGTNQPGSQGYVPLIENRLAPSSHMLNLGVSGIHLHEALTQELPLALSTNPQLITIWLVTNDFVAGVPYDSYMHDLDAMLKQLRASTQSRIVMANLPDVTLLPALSRLNADKKVQMRNEVQRWNTQIASLAHTYRVGMVDLKGEKSELTSHPEYISGDGFHPSPAGYVQLANYFWTAIKAN